MNKKHDTVFQKNKISRNCPVCLSSLSKHFMDENYDSSKINQYTFASRKNPEFMCHKLVLCQVCDLVYADNPPNEEELSNLYHQAEFDSNDEANAAASSYINSLSIVFNSMTNLNSALDIGTGTGILLDKLKEVGFKKVVGIEPSILPIKAAPDYRKDWIINDIFKDSYFNKNSFDFIFCAMTMEHIRDPKDIAIKSYNLLTEGGAIVFVVHDYRSFVNRLFGKKSPIIDIEHLQLFSKKSIHKLLTIAGYENISIRSFKNSYPLKYWLRLTPLPDMLKSILMNFFKFFRLDNIKISFNVGNLLAYGFKKTQNN